jgi:hypothetical protein
VASAPDEAPDAVDESRPPRDECSDPTEVGADSEADENMAMADADKVEDAAEDEEEEDEDEEDERPTERIVRSMTSRVE